MTSRPLVSAIVASHGRGAHLEEAVESVLAQDYPADQLEVIVMDDGLSGDVRGKLWRYAARVKYSTPDDGGQATAVNRVLAGSRAEVVAFLKEEDVWYPDKIARVVNEFARCDQTGLVYHNVRESLSIGKYVPPPVAPGDMVRMIKRLVLRDLIRGRISSPVPIVPASSVSFRRSFLSKITPIPKVFLPYADAYLTYYIVFFAKTACIADCLGEQRVTAPTLTARM